MWVSSAVSSWELGSVDPSLLRLGIGCRREISDYPIHCLGASFVEIQVLPSFAVAADPVGFEHLAALTSLLRLGWWVWRRQGGWERLVP